MNETIRTFIAIELTSEIQTKLSKIQKELKKAGADVKWVKPENIHLTLKFLGNVEIEKLENIYQVLERIAKDFSSFNLALFNVGAFPKIESPRVIWVGIEQGKQETLNLAKEIEQSLEKLGFPKEGRVFSAHITIGRIRSSLNRMQLVEALKKIKPWQNLNQEVSAIKVFKSTLLPTGPIYEALKEINLS